MTDMGKIELRENINYRGEDETFWRLDLALRHLKF